MLLMQLTECHLFSHLLFAQRPKLLLSFEVSLTLKIVAKVRTM